MNKKVVFLFAMTLLNFSSINAMDENQQLIKYLLNIEKLNSKNIQPYKELFKLYSGLYLYNSDPKKKGQEQLKEYFDYLLKNENYLNKILEDKSFLKLKSNIKLVQNYIKNDWILNKSIPSEIISLFKQYNEYCQKNLNEKEVTEAHKEMKKHKINGSNKLWMLPNRLEDDIYFIYHPNADKKAKTKEWNDSKSKKGTNRFGEVLKGEDGLFAIEIGELFSSDNDDSQHSDNGQLSTLNSKSRLIIVWKQNDSNELIKLPTLYLTKHYKDPFDVTNLNLD